MNVLLKPELEKFVADKVKAGQYADASDMVNEALEMLKDQEEFTPEHEQYLRRVINRGLDDLKHGRVSVFDAEKIIAEKHRRLAGGNEQS
jgi:putative addiction module CopG family antidote